MEAGVITVKYQDYDNYHTFLLAPLTQLIKVA